MLALFSLPVAVERWRTPSGVLPAPNDTGEIIDRLIAREGGFADHPTDRGGPTNFGITRRTLARWRGRPVTPGDVAELSVAEARDIYQEIYVRRPGFNKIENLALREQLIDAGVLSGPETAIRWLQIVLKTKADGRLGPQTIRSMKRVDLPVIRREFCKQRVLGLVRIASADPTQLPFTIGWVRRALDFLA